MNFKEWSIWMEALKGAEIETETPQKIQQLMNSKVSDLTPEQLQLLMKWHGIWGQSKELPIDDQRKRLITKRQNRFQSGRDAHPSPHEVNDRIRKALLKRGKLGGRWLKRDIDLDAI